MLPTLTSFGDIECWSLLPSLVPSGILSLKTSDYPSSLPSGILSKLLSLSQWGPQSSVLSDVPSTIPSKKTPDTPM